MILWSFCFDYFTVHFVNRILFSEERRTIFSLCTSDGISPPEPGVLLPQLFYQHNAFVWFVWIAEQTAIISLYNIN